MVNICSTLRSNKARSLDNISTSLIKEIFTSISSPLTHVFNLLLSSGVVPETKDCACRNIV